MTAAMNQRARLRFWLAMLDVAHYLRAPAGLYLWIVARASAAEDWGPAPEPEQDDGDKPW